MRKSYFCWSWTLPNLTIVSCNVWNCKSEEKQLSLFLMEVKTMSLITNNFIPASAITTDFRSFPLLMLNDFLYIELSPPIRKWRDEMVDMFRLSTLHSFFWVIMYSLNKSAVNENPSKRERHPYSFNPALRVLSNSWMHTFLWKVSVYL